VAPWTVVFTEVAFWLLLKVKSIVADLVYRKALLSLYTSHSTVAVPVQVIGFAECSVTAHHLISTTWAVTDNGIALGSVFPLLHAINEVRRIRYKYFMV
jgi:hypothetical protein